MEERARRQIVRITEKLPIREKAFATIMRQSGLRPQIIQQLKIQDVERILEPNPLIPCRIRVDNEKLPTFVGEEAVKYLKRYLRSRKDNLKPESLLFSIRNNPKKQINTKDVSRTFQKIARKLLKANVITYEQKKGKPSELRLYSTLKTFYETNAEDYLTQLRKNYKPEELEFFRTSYQKEAMPFLEIELLTTLQTRQIRRQLREIENLLPKEPENDYGRYLEENPQEDERLRKQCEKDMEDNEKWRREHPEEAKLEDEQTQKDLAYFEEHDTQLHIEYLQDEVKQLKNRLSKIEEIVSKNLERRSKRK